MTPSELINTLNFQSEVDVEDTSSEYLEELKREWSRYPSAVNLVRALLDGEPSATWRSEFDTSIHLGIGRVAFLVTDAVPAFAYVVTEDVQDVFVSSTVEKGTS